MKNNIILYFLSFFLITACKKNEESPSPQSGEIKIVADDAFRNVTDALSERYMAFYPNAKISVEYKKEDSAFINLLQNKSQVIVMSRELTEKEKNAYENKVDLKFQPAKFAGDAVVFIVPKDNTKEYITTKEVEEMLKNTSEKKLIFDGNNGSNINFVTQKLKLNPSKENLSYGIIKGNENIIKEIGKYKDKIGVVSLNTISRNYSPEIQNLKSNIKILPIKSEDGNMYTPNLENIKNMKYPFTRILYFLTNEGFFGLSNGFIRFSCTQIGQIVVAKQGLQPYNNYKREVQMR